MSYKTKKELWTFLISIGGITAIQVVPSLLLSLPLYLYVCLFIIYLFMHCPIWFVCRLVSLPLPLSTPHPRWAFIWFSKLALSVFISLSNTLRKYWQSSHSDGHANIWRCYRYHYHYRYTLLQRQLPAANVTRRQRQLHVHLPRCRAAHSPPHPHPHPVCAQSRSSPVQFIPFRFISCVSASCSRPHTHTQRQRVGVACLSLV